MKRTINTIALLMALLMLAMVFSQAALAEGSYVKTAGNVNVRSGAGTEYRVLGTAAKNSELTYLDEAKTDKNGVVWYRVRLNARTVGWVCSKYCAMYACDTTVEVTGGEVYLRRTPSLNGTVLATKKQGDKLIYLNETSTDNRGVTWYYVSADGKTGWISSKYAKLTNGGSDEYKVAEITGDQVYLRGSASLNGRILDTLYKGSTPLYLNESKQDSRGVTWYYVRANGGAGWVSSKYAKLRSASANTGADSHQVVITGRQVYMRREPSLSGNTMEVLYKGETAIYLEQSSVDSRGVTWYNVRTDSGAGWVSSKYATVK